MIYLIPGSIIASAWRTVTEEWENTSRLIKANAEALESRALDRLTTLMTERRKSRKTYQEDHTKVSSQFTQVSMFFLFVCLYYVNCTYRYYDMLIIYAHISRNYSVTIIVFIAVYFFKYISRHFICHIIYVSCQEINKYVFGFSIILLIL